MLVVTTTYTAPLEEVDRHREAHLAWLDDRIAEGRILAAGRQTPPVGAVLLLPTMPEDEARALFAQDPYALAGVAEYGAPTQFTAAKRAPGLDLLADQPAAG